ncbi:MAG: lipid A export permease/ATP-binding protein MsbA [Gammaproteobacteria bacterium]|nr:lipid A export permease/ATP-binding protein MsbA [Gammaproteobacteria bacterium]
MTQPQAAYTGWQIYRRLLRYTVPYWRIFLVALFGMLLFSVTASAFSKLIEPMVDGSFINKNKATAHWVPMAIIGVFAIRTLGTFLSDYGMSWIARSVVRDLRTQLFDHLLRLPTAYYDKAASGTLVSKMVYDVEQLADAASRVVTVFIRDSLTVIGLLGLMFYQSKNLTSLLLIIFPLLVVIVTYVSRRFRKLSHRIQHSMGDVSTVTQEVIDANREVKIFGGHQHEKQAFGVINAHNRRQFLKFAATNAISTPLIEQIVATTFAGIVYFATQQNITPGEFMSFVMAMVLLLQHARRLATINSSLQRGIAAAQSTFSFLDLPIEQDSGKRVLERVKGNVEYRNVTFRYHENSELVLDNIELTINPGESVAFVGRSGAGKTTLVSLLPRFYELSQGQILIDGVSTQDISLASLRSQIALVSQHVTLFNDTIAHNIAYGALENTTHDAIVRAARAAHALEFIEQLPEGFNTIVGENGVLLSGGQRQRLAIARAILKDAPILILDEATSALDNESERLIQAALNEVMRDRTTLVIAHRLSTIERVDKIVVMEHGQIVEVGNHAALLAKEGAYANLYQMQFASKN